MITFDKLIPRMTQILYIAAGGMEDARVKLILEQHAWHNLSFVQFLEQTAPYTCHQIKDANVRSRLHVRLALGPNQQSEVIFSILRNSNDILAIAASGPKGGRSSSLYPFIWCPNKVHRGALTAEQKALNCHVARMVFDISYWHIIAPSMASQHMSLLFRRLEESRYLYESEVAVKT